MESNFDELNGISWDKGCYMGQELTARTKYRGLVKKRLMMVAADRPLPGPGTPILRDGTVGGELGSGLDGRAIGRVRLVGLPRGGLLDGYGLPLRPENSPRTAK